MPGGAARPARTSPPARTRTPSSPQLTSSAGVSSRTRSPSAACRPRATAAKLFVPLAEAPDAPTATLSVPERYWAWTALGADGTVAPVVCCYAGSAAALRRLEVEDGPDTWLGSLRAFRPDLALEPDGVILSTWTDPWARGAFGVQSPSAEPGDEETILRTEGPLVFCGEHTAGDHAGLMEGALRSGLRAADAVGSRA